MLDDLLEITLDNRNTVIVFSKVSKKVLSGLFVKIPEIWLAAESGYLYKMGELIDWHKLISLANNLWMNTLIDIINFYADNVDGSYLEVRESTLVYYFKNAEEEHGNMAAKLLYE